jgi:hypothetical protein
MLAASAVYAQEEADFEAYLELMRSDVRANKVAIITETMQFTPEEGEAFWPIYRKYELELSALNDEKIDMIKDYAEHYLSLDDAKANELMKRAMKLDEKQLALQKKYFNRYKKVLPAKTAAKYMQLERQITAMINLQIASELPLIE